MWKNIFILLIAVPLLGARHETPIHVYDRPHHDAACDYAVSHQPAKVAADLCLQAADEWAVLAAKHDRQAESRYYEMMEMLTRLETSNEMRLAHSGYAFGQMQLAVGIARGICEESDLLQPEIAFCNAVAEQASAQYPKVWKMEKAK